MGNWMRRAGRAVLMGLLWAVAWSPIGPIIGFIVDRDGRMDEPWIAVGALPGFLSGVAFSVVLMVAARGRQLSDLSVARMSVFGAIGGLLAVMLPYLASFPEPDGRFPFMLSVAIACGLLGAASAAGSLVLARKAEGNVLDGDAQPGRG